MDSEGRSLAPAEDGPRDDDVRSPWSGELALRWAVLLAAIASYQETRFARRGLPLIRHQQDKRWFNSPDRTWPFSFLNICDAIGVEVSCVKRSLLKPAPR